MPWPKRPFPGESIILLMGGNQIFVYVRLNVKYMTMSYILGRPLGFHKMRRISKLAEKRLASQEGLCSME
jgi:hypothetical protein